MSEERATILIVDDTPANLNVLSSILRQESYRVRAVPHGEGALKTIAASPPDLILLDIQMPDIDGFEVCRRLKSDPASAHIPIIFISALDDGIDKVEAFRVGGVDYITKPFQIEEVLIRIETHLTIAQNESRLNEIKTTAFTLMNALDLEAMPQHVRESANRLNTLLNND
jgi:DNA-binding response OmpR family regulator